MSDLLKSIGFAALVAVASPALAQDATPPADAPAADAPAAEAPAAAPADAPVTLETYVDEQFGDWQRECLRLPADSGQPDPCRMVQILTDAAKNPVGKIAIGRQGEATGSGEVALPTNMGLYLPEGIAIGVDDGLKKTYGYYRCLPDACSAQLRFNADDVAAFKAGDQMNLNVVAFLPEDRRTPVRLQIPVSLKGFTKAFESLAVPAPAPAAQ